MTEGEREARGALDHRAQIRRGQGFARWTQIASGGAQTRPAADLEEIDTELALARLLKALEAGHLPMPSQQLQA